MVGIGVLWEALLAPSMSGWGFIVIGFLMVLLVERQWPVRTPLDWALLLLALMAGCSLLVTALPEVTLVQVMRLGAGLAGFYGLVNWARNRARLSYAAAALAAGGVGLALLAPVVVDWHRAKAVLIPSSFYRFPLLVSDPVHPNIMAALMVLLFPLPLAQFLSPTGSASGAQRIVRRLALGGACLVMGVVLLLTKSRGGYVAGAVGGLLVVWCSWRKRWALVLTLGVIALGTLLFVAMGSRSPELVEGAVDPSTWAFRQQVWRTALQMLADFPFTGVGMGTFNDVATVLYAFQETHSLGAHSLYLQVGVDLGLPGLIACLAALLLTLWMAATATRTLGRRRDGELRAMALGALAGVVALMIHGLVDHVAWNTRAAFVPWVVIGLVTALYRWVTVEDPCRRPFAPGDGTPSGSHTAGVSDPSVEER